MKLKEYGYKKEEIKVRTMSILEMRVSIVRELLNKDYRYVNIRLINTTLGEINSFRSTEDFLITDFFNNTNDEHKIDLISVKEADIYSEKRQIIEKRIIIVIRETQMEEGE